tara:strand:+ start:259 stop:525 length:267 start_codon:yes stop_codon:yes gene_type:complete
MKKLSLFFFVLLIWCNVSFSGEPSYSENSLNENISEWGWEIDDKEFLKPGKGLLEIYTLELYYDKKDWILKCQITYYYSSSDTYCRMP